MPGPDAQRPTGGRPTEVTPAPGRQPLLHDLVAVLAAPTQVWSGPDGQVRALPGGAHGVYHADVRVLSEAVLTVDGEEPEVIAVEPLGAGRVRVVALPRVIDAPGADPTARLEVERTVTPGECTHVLTLSCSTERPVGGTVRVRLAADLAAMDAVKDGRGGEPAPATRDGGALVWEGTGGAARGVRARVEAGGARVDSSDPAAPVLEWSLEARTGHPATVTWRTTCTDEAAAVTAPPTDRPEWSHPVVETADPRTGALLDRALDDLAALRMSSSHAPDEVFLAAGAPWFLTLFGRDSLWAARMLLPLGTDLALGTLRTLAAAQGRRTDAATAEQPGKILHEVRRAAIGAGDGVRLPPLYYGTIDATPLWVCLLVDAWRWGLEARHVEDLLPAAERALAWMAEHGDADGDGFLEYVDTSGHGLANQGWKDSGDSVQWRDGSLASGAIALCEVQGYAHEAARGGADLLDAFGRPGAARWRAWADALAARFRERFWVTDTRGSYPAIALDGEKHPVDTLTSNIGHLLGTGLLTRDEEAAVAGRLVDPVLASGYGLRTLAVGSGGYWPLRYHGGTVWPHDTAIAVHGLTRAGFRDEAAALAGGLVAAGPGFGYRLPELFAGDGADAVPRPVPYPAACRPQAWSAASAVTVALAGLGLVPDVPAGTLTVNPAAGTELSVSGLRLAGRELHVAAGAYGGVRVRTDAPVTVRTPGRDAVGRA